MHAGRNTQFGFFGGSLHVQAMVNHICAGKDSGPVERQFAHGQPSVGSNPVTDSRPRNGLSLSRSADQGLNPAKHKL